MSVQRDSPQTDEPKAPEPLALKRPMPTQRTGSEKESPEEIHGRLAQQHDQVDQRVAGVLVELRLFYLFGYSIFAFSIYVLVVLKI